MCETRRLRLTAAAFALVIAATTDAEGQYFGQNKVRFDALSFQVLKTTHFDIHFYDEEQRVIDEAGQLAERWYARLSSLLDHQLRGRQPIVFYASHPHFRQTTVISGFIDPSTGGVTEGLRRRVVMPFTGALRETNHVLGHELVHAFQYDMGDLGITALPLWFIEGMAEYLSVGPVSAQTAAWLRDAALHEELPRFEDLHDPRYFPYRFGHAAWAYLAGRYGADAVRELFLLATRLGDPIRAIEQFTGTPIAEISRAWHQAIASTYALDRRAAPRGRPLITEEGDGGRLNVGPALSPDGTRLVFLSERDVFSIEMFLADARTGEVIRKLTEIATDPHLDNIQFLESTGAWSSDGRQFAYAAEEEADPVLVVVDATSGDTVRRIALPELGEIFTPTWSPDGRAIAFSGMEGGTSDLYIYDLRASSLRRVTNDLYAQIQPAWSPDGRTIAAVTDRFTTRIDTLDFGTYRIAAYDTGTGNVRLLPGFDAGTNLSPQWAPGGEAMYFVGAPNGIPNVFRVNLRSGQIDPVTAVATAVSGITDTAPALAVASRSGDVAYSVYVDGAYAIYTIDAASAAQPVAIADINGAVLPPSSPAARLVAENLRAAAPLPPSRSFRVEAYAPRLSLQYVGPAALANLRADEFGAFVGGGIGLLFGDTLNHHQLAAAVETAGGVSDIAAQVTYLNQASRWNWGAAVQRVPYRTGAFSSGVTQVDGRQVIVEQTEIFRQVSYELNGLAEYPFSRRARLEFSGGLRRIAFDHELRTDLLLPNGQLIDEQARDLAAPAALNLGRTSAAFVFDSAIFGGTGPVLGTRARLEASPILGDIQFTEALFDYRRYFAPLRPMTIAARVLHFGRYGGDSESGRLTPLFIGYPNLVRGYDVDSFAASECQSDGQSNCPEFEQLLGSRVLVGNLELRIPVPGIFSGEFRYGPLPIEAFAFADTGVAWTSTDEPSFLDGTRDFVSSVGVGARVNLLGYFITEFNVLRPIDRPDDGWMFQFNVRPGF